MPSPTRRTILKTAVAGAASALGASGADGSAPVGQPGGTSSGGAPGRRTYPRLPFEAVDPWVTYEGYRFTARVLTVGALYHLDPEKFRLVEAVGQNAYAESPGLRLAGGQVETQPEVGGAILFRVPRPGVVQWIGAGQHPLETSRAIVTVVETLPRGRVAPFGHDFFDPGEDEILLEYPPPEAPRGIPVPSTAFLVEPREGPFLAVYNLDGVVRPKRMLLRPVDGGFRLECVNEERAQHSREGFQTTAWRIAPGDTPEDALAEYFDYLGRVHRMKPFGERGDVPEWAFGLGLVVNLHGMHPTERIFLDYRGMLDALRWVAERFPPERCLAVLAGWGGPHGRTTPYEAPHPRLGGEDALRALVGEARRMGFHLAPVVSLASVSRRDDAYASLAPALALSWEEFPIEGRRRDADGDLALDTDRRFVNPGHPLWQEFFLARIGGILDEHGFDAIVLDGSDVYANDPRHDVFRGVADVASKLRADRPGLLVAGSGWYDGLLAATPFVQGAPPPGVWGGFFQKFARAFSPLSHPAPGTGSTGVDPAGVRAFDEASLGLDAGAIPTLALVDGTLREHGRLAEKVIGEARRRLGI